MKRMISWILTLVLVLSLFTGCGAPANNAEPTKAPEAAPAETEAVVVADENLENAAAYLKAFYKNVKDGDLTPADYERLGTVRVAGVAYEVVYTVDCADTVVKVVKGDNGMVTMDVNEACDVEVPYVLTATITGTDGKTASLSWKHVVPAVMNSDEIVDAAYALEDGKALGYEATLTGEIISVDTPYSADYKNITVSIKVAGREDKPIMCYRLKGDGADGLMVGDIITVTGSLKNYKGTIEFDAGCILDEYKKGENSVEIPTDPQEILEAAFALDYGKSLPYPVTLTGKIVGIGSKYSEKYGNITVTIKTGDPWYCVTCFRMKGADVDKIWLDDVITVTGNMKNYNGTIEFDAGCQLVSWTNNPDPVAPSDPAKILEATEKLGHRDTLSYPCTLTGTVTKIVSSWSDKYGNITVDMAVSGAGGKVIQCYRLNGGDSKDIAVGDTITVNGWLMNYNGTIEFKQGCSLMNLVKASGGSGEDSGEEPELTGLAKDLADASKLANKSYLDRVTTVTGTITNDPKASSYNAGQYNFTISAEGHTITCYYVNVVGGTPAKGDTVTVSGQLTAYNGTAQFDSASTATLAGGEAPEEPETPDAPAVDASSSFAEVAAAAKALGTNAYLDFEYTISGTIKAVYNNNNGTYNVPINTSEGQVNCNNMTGDADAMAALAAGDTITVCGKLGVNKKGVLSFSGCALVAHTASEPEATEPEVTEPEAPSLSTLDEIVAAAFGLASGETLAGGPFTLTGTVGEITGAYDESYGTLTLNLTVAGRSIQCKYVGGEKAATVAVGDTISVSGNLQNYNGTVQIYKGTIVG